MQKSDLCLGGLIVNEIRPQAIFWMFDFLQCYSYPRYVLRAKYSTQYRKEKKNALIRPEEKTIQWCQQDLEVALKDTVIVSKDKGRVHFKRALFCTCGGKCIMNACMTLLRVPHSVKYLSPCSYVKATKPTGCNCFSWWMSEQRCLPGHKTKQSWLLWSTGDEVY